MASLQGLPPLPKSLSGLLSFSSAQWKEMERIHAMRQQIQHDLVRGNQTVSGNSGGDADRSPEAARNAAARNNRVRKTSTLDVHLAVLRKEMVGLRQLDMSLLCQLWSLNESLLDYKQLLQERLSRSLSHASPGWDKGDEASSCDEPDSPGPFSNSQTRTLERRRQQRQLQMVREDRSLSSSTSHSSLEFGDI